MALSWNEIKQRATQFSREWEGESSEDAEAKSFWDGFFHIFGIPRRRVASFEQAVRLPADVPLTITQSKITFSSLATERDFALYDEAPGKSGGFSVPTDKSKTSTGYIDLLWKGTLLVEHKSKGKDLDRAFKQAKDYFPGLKDSDLPKYILVSDFERFRLYNLEDDSRHDFLLKDFVGNVHLFDFIAGYQKRSYKEQDPVNIAAAEMMGKLHDGLKAIGYEGHRLELYLVRLLFCLFADDTTIFDKGIFYDFLDQRTAEDGSDLARSLAELFEVLDTPKERRMRNLDEQLDAFPYVNGKLFEERLPIAHFDSKMRQSLLDCSALDWGKISPAIFGSLFQSVMDETARRNLGAHYTSEKNILKLIKPLFLDALWAEYEAVKGSRGRLQNFHKKISSLRFLDPACGCGNFLIIAYRELRLLELEVVKTLLFTHMKLREEVAATARMDIGALLRCDVDKFYGIEYEEFPAQIAQVAMWLIDHQMNMRVSEAFGEYYVRLPLRKSATIVHGNALRTEWQSLLQRDLKDLWNGEKDEAPLRYDYILGNPPFIGSKMMNETQRKDIVSLFAKDASAGVLDYVSGWFALAAQYVAKYNPEGSSGGTRCAFVSTNSITQGEQVSTLWGPLLQQYRIKIHLAHQTFKWSNEAKGNASVYCVIIGFSNFDLPSKRLFLYERINAEPLEVIYANINPYLIPAKDVIVSGRSSPIASISRLVNGSLPADGGNLVLSAEQKEEIINQAPRAAKWIRPYLGAEGFINNEHRFCLWLKHCPPDELKAMPAVLKRLQAVKEMRLNSSKEATRKKASTPSLFTEDRQPENGYYIAIPRTSSERRTYVPIGYLSVETIATNDLQIVPNGTLYEFGILTSLMHMAWVRQTAGRLKSDIRYSALYSYNTFPWPESPSQKNIKAVEAAAQKVLDTRAAFPTSSLADLYDPLTMPAQLAKAHAALDKAVDVCYRPQVFPNEAKRMEFLFDLYDKYTAGMFAEELKSKRKKSGTK